MNARVIRLHPNPEGAGAGEAPEADGLGLRRALQRDITAALEPLGIDSLRAFAVDLRSMHSDAAWWFNERGDTADEPPGDERRIDSAFPGAMLLGEQLAEVDGEQVLVQKINHRRWAYAWRLGEHHGLIAEACYRMPRATPGDAERSVLRFVCHAGLRVGEPPRAVDAARRSAMEWQHEPLPPAPAAAVPPAAGRGARAGLLMLALAALLSAVLALAVAPRAGEAAAALDAEVGHWRQTADRSMQRQLSLALASGDYGEVQDALGGLSTSGYFRVALVTNARDRVVAMVGPVPDQKIGDELRPEVARAARPLPLELSSQALGKVLVVTEADVAGAAAASPGLVAVRLLGGAAAMCAAIGLFLAWPRRRGATSP